LPRICYAVVVHLWRVLPKMSDIKRIQRSSGRLGANTAYRRQHGVVNNRLVRTCHDSFAVNQISDAFARRPRCRRSTDGTAWRCTESRPIGESGEVNSGISVGFPTSGRTITGNIRRRIRTGTAALAAVGCPSNPRSYRWGRRRRRGYKRGFLQEATGLAAS